jgi:serine protease Do
MKNIILILIFLTSYEIFAQTSFFGNRETTKKRIENIKKSTVKILVDNIKSGTGFFVSSDGILVTNWHVVINDKTKLDDKGNILNKFSIVDFKNDTIPVNIILNLSKESVLEEAIVWDYCILKTNKKTTSKFLKLGKFKNAYEGELIYTCGFPLDLDDPFLTTGILSTLSIQSLTINSKKQQRQIAWLDMTTNKGNSGGALMTLGKNPEDDEVIGITSFITVPFYKDLEELNKYVTETEKIGTVEFMGINFLRYIKLINTAVNSNSVGISGCISIEKVSAIINENNK